MPNSIYAESFQETCFFIKFLLIFEVSTIIIGSVSDDVITGYVGWNDEDDDEELEEVRWNVQHRENLRELGYLIDLLMEKDLISIDKILINTEMMQSFLDKSTNRDQKLLDMLLDIEMERFEGEERCDSFFLHL